MNFARFLLLLLLISQATLSGQPSRGDSDIKLRLAQSYERSGEFDAALKLYRELFSKDSTNMLLFDALRRTYFQLKKYDDAIALFQRMLRTSPNDIALLTQLASAYVLKPDDQKAAESWERAIAVEPKNENTYRIVASSMIQNRLFDRAIEVYRRGRTACNNPALFAADIGYLYSIVLKYPEATREYLTLIGQSPLQLSFVQSRIAAYTGRPDGLRAATTVVEEAVGQNSDNLPYQQLLAWLYMEGRRFDRAYDVFQLIDERSHAGGHELFNFAGRSLKEHACDASGKAYLDIMKKFPSFDRMAEVKFGYARTLEESDEETDSSRLFGVANPFPSAGKEGAHPLLARAIEAYSRVITEYPKTDIAAQSLLRVAIAKQEKLFDLDGARTALSALSGEPGTPPPIRDEAILRLGEVYLEMDDADQSEKQYLALGGAGRGLLTSPLQQLAVFRIAELNYFRGKFPEALAGLKELTRNTGTDVVNDALSLQIFIQENTKSSPDALRAYAIADLRKRQRKLPEALTAFQNIVQTYPKSDLVDESLIDIGDILTQMSRYPEAVSSYERLLNDYPESIARDRTLLKMAQVYQLGIKDPTKAIATYQKLLEEFPGSIYSSEARKRIREIRGDSI